MLLPSSLPTRELYEIKEVIDKICIKSNIERKNEITSHLSQYIKYFRDRNTLFSRKIFLQLESLESIKRWGALSKISIAVPSFLFSLAETDKEDLLMGLKGICAGMVAQYLGRFFQVFSPLEASPFPLDNQVLRDPTSSTSFYPFSLSMTQTDLIKNTKNTRFLQAAYRTAYMSKNKTADSLEFLPQGILKKVGVRVVSREPPHQSGLSAHEIEQLLPQLKLLESSSVNSGYLIALGGATHHALAIFLHPPFHFMDPTYGIGIADNLESLLLFLVNFVTFKYPKSASFSLLEFRH